MKMENRKRNIQVKFRLTQEENDVLSEVVNGSGMTKNDYIIQTLINKITLPILSWEKRYNGNDIEISCKFGKQVAGYARCSAWNEQTQIHSLFVAKTYRNSNLMETILQEVYEFAEENNSTSIKICCGAEPMAKDGQIPLDKEIKFYENNGFVRKVVLGGFPCMVKAMI